LIDVKATLVRWSDAKTVARATGMANHTTVHASLALLDTNVKVSVSITLYNCN